MAKDGVVYVQVSGLTGTGKSAVYVEIFTALTAIGLNVEHASPSEAAAEMRQNGLEQLEDYNPRVILSEHNIPRLVAPKRTLYRRTIDALMRTLQASPTP